MRMPDDNVENLLPATCTAVLFHNFALISKLGYRQREEHRLCRSANHRAAGEPRFSIPAPDGLLSSLMEPFAVPQPVFREGRSERSRLGDQDGSRIQMVKR